MNDMPNERIDPETGMERALEQAVDILARHVLGRDLEADVDVGAIRQATGLTQQAFARTYGIPVATLRNWEQGRRKPDGPARALLQVIARDAELRGEASSKLSMRDAATGAEYPLEDALSQVMGEDQAKAVVTKLRRKLGDAKPAAASAGGKLKKPAGGAGGRRRKRSGSAA
jgi:putative transcriptional regulator